MPTIAIIDDRQEQRETLKHLIDLDENGTWQTLDIDPLPSLDNYIPWIRENDVAVILLDEKLNEITHTVNYSGHNFVDYIRARNKELPIFIITSFADDDAIKARFKDVEDIIQRGVFVKDPDNYIQRFIRSGQRFMEAFEENLSELAKISKKVVANEATREDIEKVNAIREKMEIEFNIDSLTQKNDLINQFSEQLSEFEQIKKEIEEFLKT